MSFQSLPAELLDNISQFLYPQDLARLARTCSRCLFPAQRFLYRDLSISPVFRNLDALPTIVKNPHLAPHIRSFSIELDSGATVLQSYYRGLAFALKLMSQLRSLQLSIDPGCSWVLDGVHPRSLTRFACSFPLDLHVTRFLHSTPTLVELDLDSPHEVADTAMPSIGVELIPNLEQFSGSCHAAGSIVPGRPVHSVHLSTGDLTENVVEQLALSASGIAVLMATSSLPAPRLLHLLSRHMQPLVYLRLMTTCDLSEATDADIDFYGSVATALSGLPDLQAFELSGMHWGALKKQEEDNHEQTVWQATPLSSEFPVTSENIDTENYSDLFLGL
ncbi:hypothetical protein V5O48_001230 [Marasmius crinis-equi]|uniref:F-box domain-containing protein n=1 Tax=Marasmius crinis-equi TaxID=585013 RepID=A0ABR3FZI5_9AGAR